MAKRVFSEPARKNMSLAHIGLKASLETRKNMSLSHSGEKHYNWKGGRSKLYRRIRNTRKNQELRKQCFDRDNYTCQFCNRTGCYFESDHIIPVIQIILKYNITTIEQALNCKELWDINNLRTLCRPCHLKTDTYGWNSWQRNLKK